MSGGSKRNSSGLNFSGALARVLPKSAPTTPGSAEGKKSEMKDYFCLRRWSRVGSIPSIMEEKGKGSESPKRSRRKSLISSPPLVMSPTSSTSTTFSIGTAAPTSPTSTSVNRYSIAGSTVSRQGSSSSLSFQMASDTTLAQGEWKSKSGRLRDSTPPPERFRSHVSFDSVPAGDATKSNTASVVLNCKHEGYLHSRRSRTFMVGVDGNSYSDDALEYLLARQVESGDHVVCVCVIEKDVRSIESSYVEQARAMMQELTRKNYELSDAAINITLEYAVGKRHHTFQRLIQIYQPGMLIVGTKGRSGGIQGLMGSRSSFSKYCLQYSPIPVVVVRPADQRAKKKHKRKIDSSRGSYAKILAQSSGGVHEADADPTSSEFELEPQLPKAQEAREVAQAIGLRASFDPAHKQPAINKYLSNASPTPAIATSVSPPSQAEAAAPMAEVASDGEDASDDASDDDDEEEQPDARPEVVEITKQKKERLHMMEVGEAAALLKHEEQGEEGEDDDDDSSSQEGDLTKVSSSSASPGHSK